MHLPKAYAKVMGAALPALRCRSQHTSSYAPSSGTSLAWPRAANIFYTDGSCKPPKRSDATQGTAAHIVGASVYCKAAGLQLRVNPCGLGPTNTITRAELVAIWCSLQHAPQQACVIATDSKASMHMIQNELAGLEKNRFPPHRVLLTAIAARLLERAQAGLSTTIIKVKAHTGTDGNERADKLANEARDSACCDLAIQLGNVARDGLY